jgi:hypothetical protein
MALNLGTLVAAARQAEDQASVTDRWQNAGNNIASGIGQILGYLYGGKLVGGISGGGNNGTQQMLGQKNSISNIMKG